MRSFLFNLLIVLCTWSCHSHSVIVNETQKPPNVVLFLVDDLGWMDTSIPIWERPTHFNTIYKTPNLEKLVRQGMLFTSAYATPVCSPSRISLMTGMNAARHRVTNWTLHPNVLKPLEENHKELQFPFWNVNGLSSDSTTKHAVHVTSLAQQLKDAGYYTIHTGKAHFGAKDTPGEEPLHLGFDVNIAGHAAGAPASYYGVDHFGNKGSKQKSPWPVPGLEKYHGEDIFLTEALTQEAIHAMSDRKENQAFFLYMAYYGVHTPIMADKRFYASYLEMGLDTVEAKYASMIQAYDKSIGDIYAYVESEDLLEETVFLFMSDNGGLSAHTRAGELHTHNSPLKSGKGSVYEGGIRVPMVASWKTKIPQGVRIDEPIIIEDFYPTIMELAELPVQQIDHTIDGMSFKDILLTGEVEPLNRPLVWHYPNKWGAEGPGIGSYSAMRKGEHKIIYNHLTQELEVYNLIEDIGETHNLYPQELNLAQTLASDLSSYLIQVDAQMPAYRWKKRTIPLPDQAISALTSSSKTYKVMKVKDQEIAIDGQLEQMWENAILLNDITAPWDETANSETSFRALFSDSQLLFSFVVNDPEIILANAHKHEEDNAVRSDRVELFFRKPYTLSPYYAFEMDAAGRLFDSEGQFYRGIDQHWNLSKDDIQLRTTQTNSGYILEGSINLDALHALGLISRDNTIRTGIFRGDYHTDTEDVTWISWIQPDSKTPDFHIPSSFGTLKLVD